MATDQRILTIPTESAGPIELRFNSTDTYNITPLGCHTVAIGNLSTVFPQSTGAWGRRLSDDELDTHKGTILTALIEFMKTVKSRPDNPMQHMKSHVIMSCNCGSNGSGTAQIMNIIIELCDSDPERWGRYSLTPATKNMAHPTAYDLNVTLVWIPPYVYKVPRDTLYRVTGAFPGESKYSNIKNKHLINKIVEITKFI